MYKGYRFPREIELLMAARGMIVSYETVRTWCTKFGSEYARRLRRRAPRPGDKWHLDEVFVNIGGVRKYLWRAVDQHGNVLDILIQGKWDGKAATRFFRMLLKEQGRRPRVLITDKLPSYQLARRKAMSTTEHRQNKYVNKSVRELLVNRPGNANTPSRVPHRRLSATGSGLVRPDLPIHPTEPAAV